MSYSHSESAMQQAQAREARKIAREALETQLGSVEDAKVLVSDSALPEELESMALDYLDNLVDQTGLSRNVMTERCALHNKSWDDPTHECFTPSESRERLVLRYEYGGWYVVDQYGSYYGGPYDVIFKAEVVRMTLDLDLQTCDILGYERPMEVAD